MSLTTSTVALTASDATILTAPGNGEIAVHGLYASGTGTLTIKRESASGATEIVSGLSVTDEWFMPRTINLEPGDRLIASDSSASPTISLTASGYVTEDSGIAETPFGPGPQQLIAGDMAAGFFGEVSAGELFSGDNLAFITGITEGVSQNSESGWLKFAHNNKIKYIAKKPFRHTISWDHIYSRGLVYGIDGDGQYPRGTSTNQLVKVAKSGAEFAVRLATGAGADPFPESDPLFFTADMYQMDVGGGSEWNELIYRIHQAVPSVPATDGMTADRHGGPQAGGNWANYTNGDMSIGIGNGRASWCQETSDTNSSIRVIRGYVALASFSRYTASAASSSYGWRPALELITSN